MASSGARLGPLELENRVVKAATFEGLTPGGVPGVAFQAVPDPEAWPGNLEASF